MKLHFYLIFLSLFFGHTVFSGTGDYGKTINVSGRQRMLTQKMIKSWLFIKLNVNTDQSKAELKKSIDLFEKSLGHLENGDITENILRPTNTIKKKLELIKSKWNQFKVSLNKDTELANEKEVLAMNTLAEQLLVLSDLVVAEWAQEASKNGNASLGLEINISGRQRMLSQRVSKLALLFDLYPQNDLIKKELARSIDLFGYSNLTLTHGNPKLNISMITQKSARQELDSNIKDWEQLKSIASKVLDRKSIKDQYVNLAEVNNIILRNMNNVVTELSR